ncbi:DUF899 domain-containing protein [Conexibacter woesei]|uniref:DUF899 domain-containing protein n=1 Tax=Conexibacter woesei TaxID=191495 RepID=UPI000404C3B8|nr:DUF899 domain-containing protein [Conexibacter woesei]
MNLPATVSPTEWETARRELLVKEKEHTRAGDAVAAQRRRMPRMLIEKDYTFLGPDGPMSLGDLFQGRRQLIIYRFFFEPGVARWPESGCPGCSMMADQDAHPAHINSRGITLAYMSRAPQEDIARYRARMGFRDVPWVTLTDDFDADMGVDEWHGTNVFIKDDDGRIYRTYLINNRGDERLGSTFSYLDIAPFGRQEEWEDSPAGYPQDGAYAWWRLHDEYEPDIDPWDGKLEEKIALNQEHSRRTSEAAAEAESDDAAGGCACTPAADSQAAEAAR